MRNLIRAIDWNVAFEWILAIAVAIILIVELMWL